MLIFTRRLSSLASPTEEILFTLHLTAEERTRSRYCFQSPTYQPLSLQLPRGTILQDGDFLQTESAELIQIKAKPEPVITITAGDPLLLLKAAYHLGNRHVTLEIHPHYLRLTPEPILETMLEKFGVTISREIAPFSPEVGAYHHD
ncbi:MAG: Urease accessory protein UreE [Chroococcopsis gigantea SAG 12.99]|jgi:urease accessory protein|nr:urease accessory protein UreE [Chlorogloea purpurea SAG 13.99]MDV3001654.1 Urease accessory protein UreE [Chroococcopsis gigantea SAG 12.99]